MDMDSLEKIVLTNNNLRSLHRVNFQDLTNLQKLYLGNNQVNYHLKIGGPLKRRPVATSVPENVAPVAASVPQNVLPVAASVPQNVAPVAASVP